MAENKINKIELNEETLEKVNGGSTGVDAGLAIMGVLGAVGGTMVSLAGMKMMQGNGSNANANTNTNTNAAPEIELTEINQNGGGGNVAN